MARRRVNATETTMGGEKTAKKPTEQNGSAGIAAAGMKMHKAPHRWPVVLIGIGKLFKSSGLVVVSFILKQMLAPEQHKAIEDWVNNGRLEPHNWFIHSVLGVMEKGLGLHHDTLRILHMGVIIYAGLYLIEGVGLLWDKKWAEWMVVVTTAGFLPFEMYEIFKEVTWQRVLLFVANMVVMGYLIFRLHRLGQIKRERAAAASFPVEGGAG